MANIYGQSESKCKISVYSKEETDEKITEMANEKVEELSNKVYLKDDYAIIEGTLTLSANSSSNVENYIATHSGVEIAYPTGFTQDNCICIDILVKNQANDRWSSKGLDSCSMSARGLMGAMPRGLTLHSGKMNLAIGNFYTTSWTTSYKIVLLKYK